MTALGDIHRPKLSGPLDGVYTPQLVVDGHFGLVGSDGREASSAIQRAIREPKFAIAISNVSRDGGQVTAHIQLPGDQSTGSGRGILYIALADNRAESHVARGENGGRVLTHVAVTRVLKQVGTVNLDSASAKDVTVSLEPGAGLNGLRLVVFVQDPKTGHVRGVAEQKFVTKGNFLPIKLDKSGGTHWAGTPRWEMRGE